jgi:hypothetical protein
LKKMGDALRCASTIPYRRLVGAIITSVEYISPIIDSGPFQISDTLVWYLTIFKVVFLVLPTFISGFNHFSLRLGIPDQLYNDKR